MQVSAALLVAVFTAAAQGAASTSPFADAVAVWHMADIHDKAGADSALIQNGAVQLGVELSGQERQESLRRGGDGKAAKFEGGYLMAGQGAEGELNLRGTELTLCVRLRDDSGRWSGPIFSKHGGHARLSYNLFATPLQGRMALGFELGTDFKSQPLQVSFPTAKLEPHAWHDVVMRYSGARLEFFIDGVLVDEEWPAGQLREAKEIPCLIGAEVGDDNAVHSGWNGQIDHAALWRRALTDEEIAQLSGGAEAVARNTLAMLGPEERSIKNFWKPRGEVAVGDCMPFYDGQRWHLYYLQDRHAHRSKWGLGAHQWAHASTADLVNWEHHPMAVPITDPREGSICTGSVYLRDGEYRAYYAVRSVDGTPAPLMVAMSRDGIHFEKSPWKQMLTSPYTGASARDPHVFQTKDGMFHMIVTTSLADRKGAERGCLAHLTSLDQREWKQGEPFLMPGLGGEPECAEWFEWNGWYYLVFSNGGVARYRMSREPLGPWQASAVSAFDGNQCAVMKSAPFKGGRRIGAAFLPRAGGGYAGNVVFREIAQQADGTLQTRFVPELMPRTGELVKLKLVANAGEFTGKLVVRKGEEARFTNLPRNARVAVRLEASAGTKMFGLGFRAGAEGKPAVLVRLLPDRKRVEVANGAALEMVEGLQTAITIELYLKDDMLDLSINGARTLSSHVPNNGTGDGLTLFCNGGEMRVEGLEVRGIE